MKHLNSFIKLVLFIIPIQASAQSTISFQCKELSLSKNESLKCDPISEDDPDDLAEAYSFLVAFYPAGQQSDQQRFELNFPARTGNYHWTQKSDDDKNDSLSAWLSYDMNPKVYGNVFQAHAKDFTIHVARYDAVKNGVIEGTFEGIMETYLAGKHITVNIPVKGSFHTTRTGKFGSECRKQRQAEKQVISKAVKVFDENLVKPLQAMGWQVDDEDNGLDAVIANHPGPFRPLMLCDDLFHLKLSVNPNSAYGKMLHDSAEYYANQSSQHADDNKLLIQAVKNMARIQNMQNIEIQIAENDPYIKAENSMDVNDRFTVLHIPGVAYACQYYGAPNEQLDLPKEHVSLFFGNWNGADMNAKTYVNYPFVHKIQSPFIENFYITITAPAKIFNEIIKKIDWSKLNEALTK